MNEKMERSLNIEKRLFYNKTNYILVHKEFNTQVGFNILDNPNGFLKRMFYLKCTLTCQKMGSRLTSYLLKEIVYFI